MDSLLSYFNSMIVGTFVLLLFFCNLLVKKSKVANKGTLAPQAGGAWPLIGHLKLFSKPNLHIKLANLADKYGPVFTVRIGSKPVLVLSSSKVAKELFTVNDLIVVSRPSLVSAKFMGYDYAFFPFTPFGGLYWRETRKLCISELLSNRRLEQFKHIRIQEVEGSIKDLYKSTEMMERRSGVVEIKRWLSDLNFNVLLRMVIGKKYFGNGSSGDEEEGRRLQRGITVLFHYLGMLVLRDAAPFLGWLDVGGHEKNMKETAKELDIVLQKWLEEHKRKRFLGENNGEKDFMDIMVSALNEINLEGYDADTVNKATVLAMIAGNETVTVVMTWAVSLLLNNPQAIKKAQEELDTHIGKERLVNDLDISKLVYIQAIIKETLRLYPPAIIPGPRQFTQDCTIAGYHVPKGTWLMLNLWKIQRDSLVWSDPLEFKPERFLTTHENVDVRGKNFELLPFGGGRRACPAISLGLHLLHLTLASLLHAFEISLPGNDIVDMYPGIGLTNMNTTSLEIVVSPRLPSYCFD